MAQVLKNSKTPVIDLTPMVDLGFLLITFFMFTTTMTRPQSLQLQMPYKPATIDQSTEVADDVALTLIIADQDKIYCYQGNPERQLSAGGVDTVLLHDKEALRTMIANKRSTIKKLKSSGQLAIDDELTILIKPSNKSTTGSLIELLDEMTINQIQYFSVVEISPIETALLSVL